MKASERAKLAALAQRSPLPQNLSTRELVWVALLVQEARLV